MYNLTIIDHFDAAHCLKHYPGVCSRLHGHTWKVEVHVAGWDRDRETNLVVDFRELKSCLKKVLETLDHQYLNAVLDNVDVSAELLAEYIYNQLELLLPEKIVLVQVTVWESATAGVTFRR